MKYPNAYSGVKKIFSAEILSVIGAIVLIVSALLGLIAFAAGTAAQNAEAETASSLSGIAVGFGSSGLYVYSGQA